ncbi:hypothetical protein LTR86_006583 [Recurvomyces mirabilis]|nr:hypothetical protein LTR86_006583 [Recurvomyces mirabilis]
MAASRHRTTSSEPLSIAEISTQAQAFDWNPSVAIQRWIRAAKLLLTEATICERDGNLQSAFLYLYRHAELVLDRLPKHPDYHDPAFKTDIATAKKAVMRNLQKLETWKPVLRQQHERYRATVERREAEQRRIRQERSGLQALDGPNYDYIDALDYEDESHHLSVHDNSALAVDLAHREIRKRDASRQSTRQAGISPGTVASRRRGIVVGGEDPASDSGHEPSVRDIGSMLQGARRPSRELPAPTRTVTTTNTYQYPSVPAREGVIDWQTPPLQPLSSRNYDSMPPPSKPTKERYDDATTSSRPIPPPKHLQTPDTTQYFPQTPSSKYIFKSTATTESGAPLRTILLPPDLRQTFLNLAHPNTLRNLETCAVLAATQVSNALFISHLIVPDQTSTDSTCDTTETGDNALFDYCDTHELLVCGWIHTHPSQSCFLSSRDLHTSSGYQVMLPEAIAIVCSPRHNPEWGCFRLTSPPGLQAVLECTAPGVFHPHAEQNLYTDALKPGHVVEGPGLEFEVVDLREK